MEAPGTAREPYPIVAVVGALGTQGASVITALTSSPATANWHIRALTSSPNSEAAKALSTKPNVSITYCDVNDFASICTAFHDCTHIFANTAFPGRTLLSEGAEAAEKLEHTQAMNIVRAAAATEGLRHLVFSTLLDSSVVSGGKWKIPHFSSKQGANAFILGGYPGDQAQCAAREKGWGTLRDKTTLMCLGMYGSNLLWDPYRPQKKDGTSDKYVVRLPCPADAPFMFAGDEKINVGLAVQAIFDQPARTLGFWVPCGAEQLSCRQWMAALDSAAKQQGLHKSVVFEECTLEAFEEEWGVLGTEAGIMYRYIGDERERSFQNTSGLPEVSLQELGLEARLALTSEMFAFVDCGALLHRGIDDKPRFGTIGVRD